MSAPAPDHRAHELLLADPERIRHLAGFLHQAAEQSAHAATGLRAAQHDAVWQGRAADTFRGAIGPMPARLEGLHTGFRDTGAALTAYAQAVSQLQAEYRRLSAEHVAIGAQLPGVRTDAEGARAALRTAFMTAGTAPDLVTAAQREADRTQRRLTELEQSLTHVRRRMSQHLDAFESERAGCRARIDQARCLAPAAVTATPAGLEPPAAAHLAPPA